MISNFVPSPLQKVKTHKISSKQLDFKVENESKIRPEIARARIISEVAKALIEAGVDVEAKTLNRFGSTALHFAAIWNRLEIGRMLIDAGADVRAKDYNGDTPLDDAKRHNHAKFAEMLQEKINSLPQIPLPQIILLYLKPNFYFCIFAVFLLKMLFASDYFKM